MQLLSFHDQSLLFLSSLMPIPNSQWFPMSGCWHTWPGFSSHSLFSRCWHTGTESGLRLSPKNISQLHLHSSHRRPRPP